MKVLFSIFALFYIVNIQIIDAKAFVNETNVSINKTPNVGIIGGHVAEPGMFPYIVSLQYEKGGHFCGGSLISDRFVLTAGHCVAASREFNVIVGAHNFLNRSENAQTFRVSMIARHPRHVIGRQYNDIALLKLAKPVNFRILKDGYGSTAKIELNRVRVPIGTKIIASGWGVADMPPTKPSNVLKYGNYIILDSKDCPEAYFKDKGSSSLCVGTGNGRDSPCFGDSGGPLVEIDEKSKKVKLIGIASHLSNGRKTSTGITWRNVVFTKVSSYLDWIEDITGPL